MRAWVTIRFAAFLACSWAAAVAGRPASAVAPEPPTQQTEFAPYCGAYALLAASHQLGVDVDAQVVISPEFIGSEQGSSALELMAAARKIGLHTLALESIDRDLLARTEMPVLLHVRSGDYSGKYDHWIALLHRTPQGAGIYDIGTGYTELTWGSLLWRMDGIGVLLSRAEISDAWPLAGSPLRKWAGVAGLAAALIAILWARRRLPTGSPPRKRAERLLQPMTQLAGLVFAACAVSACANLFGTDGFGADPSAVASIAGAHLVDFLPRLDAPRVERCLRDPRVLVVDARQVPDFALGHLRGAISIPPGTAEQAVVAALGPEPGQRDILIYCQSSTCPYAPTLARRLAALGYKHLMLFPGGWREWIQYGHGER